MAGIADCITDALSKGSIDKTEADYLLNRYRELEDIAASSRTGKSARSMLSDELYEQRQLAKERDILTAEAIERLQRDFRTYATQRGKRGPDLQGAMVRVFENFGDGAGSSVRGRYMALLNAAQTEMGDLLWTFRRSAVTMQRFNRPMLDGVAKAMFGEAATPAARALYDAFHGVAEKLRLRFNAAGGNIKWRKDWGIVHEHDPTAMMKAGFERWREFIEPRVDWDAMSDPFLGVPYGQNSRAELLNQVWRNVVTGGLDLKDPAMSSGARMLAATRADPRVLKFKGSKEWTEYNTQYGSGDLFDAMMGHINGLAKDTAMLERLGPNPAVAVEWMKRLVDDEAARVKVGEPSMLGAKPGIADKIALGTKHAVDGLYDFAKGQQFVDSRGGAAVVIARNVTYSAKLGSTVFGDLFTGPVFSTMAAYMHGIPFTKIATGYLKGLGTRREMLQAGLGLEDALHTLERSAREGIAERRAREYSAWLPAVTVHYSGMSAVTAMNKRAYFGAAMSTFADNIEKGFDDLPPRLRQDMESFGVTRQDWEIMRLADLHDEDTGAPILRWNDIATVGAELAPDVARILGHAEVDPVATSKAAEEAALKYLEMLHMGTAVAVPTESWRARAWVTQRAAGFGAPGTFAGETARSLAMFKSGFVATMMMTQAQMWKRELAAHPGSAIAYAAASIVGLWVGGMMILQAKQIVNGKDLLPTDPTTEQGRFTLAKAFLAGGAMGIYGDFLQSSTSSYGHGLPETLAGPIVTQAGDLLETGWKLGEHAYQSFTGSPLDTPLDDELASAARRLLKGNVPVLSTHWAFRAGFERVILDQLQAAVDDGANAKMKRAENKVRQETNQEFFWPRGEPLPERWPGPTTAAR